MHNIRLENKPVYFELYKALSHDTSFPATFDAILLLRDLKFKCASSLPFSNVFITFKTLFKKRFTVCSNVLIFFQIFLYILTSISDGLVALGTLFHLLYILV